VVEDLRPGVQDDLERVAAALEVGDEDFDGAAGMDLADALNHQRENGRAAVGALVAVDAGDDGVLEVHGLDGLGYAVGFVPVERAGAAVLDIAEAAGAGADIAQHEEGSGAPAPAVADVRAHGLFADRVQGLGPHEVTQLFIGLAAGGAHLEPVGAALRPRCFDLVQLDQPIACWFGDGHSELLSAAAVAALLKLYLMEM
jgi:hypothetical protein